MRNVAARQSIATALGKIVGADLARARGALFIPFDCAAVFKLFRSAHGRAAQSTRAAWKLMGVEAVAA